MEAALPVADNGLRKLEDAVRMFRVAMHHVSCVAVSCGKRNGGLVRVREHPKER
jgi:hypothetical protein